jgi:hypothetical protein
MGEEKKLKIKIKMATNHAIGTWSVWVLGN